MPQAKGRKKGRNRERRERSGGEDVAVVDDDGVVDATGAPVEARRVQETSVQAAAQQPAPSSMARASGAVLAMVTAVIAFYMVWNGLQAESAGAGAARVAVGLSLVLLSVVVGVLSVAPEFVRDLVMRWRK
jgi:ABC-type transport system involved in cytochrome bd biosynthesis fused ATPase/permease subunit